MDAGQSEDLPVNAGNRAQGPTVGLPGQSLGHFQLIQLLGRGGMGEVYVAYDRILHRRVALKLLPDDFAHDAQRRRRFETEARAAGTLNHTNIVTVFEFGETEGRHFLATELVEGETLEARLTRGSPTATEAIRIAAQVASALASAHAAGVLHRDLKPGNIMLRSDGVAKVLDFGLARFSEADREGPTIETRTLEGRVMGTLAYMSPEQVRGQSLDWRTDMWSLGIVLYEMLSGRRPFDGASQADAIGAILTRNPIQSARIGTFPLS